MPGSGLAPPPCGLGVTCGPGVGETASWTGGRDSRGSELVGVVMELLKKVTQHKCQSSHYQVIRDEESPRGLPGTGRSAAAPQLRAAAQHHDAALPGRERDRRPRDAGSPVSPHTGGAPAGPAAGTMRPALAAAGPRRGAQSVAALGWVMSAGTTQASNSASVTKPSSRADWRRDSPLWCAFLAILEALS